LHGNENLPTKLVIIASMKHSRGKTDIVPTIIKGNMNYIGVVILAWVKTIPPDNTLKRKLWLKAQSIKLLGDKIVGSTPPAAILSAIGGSDIAGF
jgi:hypothetical protein